MIKDYNCSYDDMAMIDGDLLKSLGLEIPDVYMHADSMAELSLAVKEQSRETFCKLPFCHTVEAEAMGGNINYGDEKGGPRAKEYVCKSVEDVLKLPEIDFSRGRIHEVLLACRTLYEQGEHVVLQVSGPFTILNTLIDIRYVVRSMRKTPEIMKQVYWKMGDEILKFIEISENYGADMISYADSSGSVKILGPKMAAQVVEDFTYDFLKKVQRIVEGKRLVLLCPKTTYTLLGTEKAVFRDRKLSVPESYGEACIEMIGKVPFSGQMCIKGAQNFLNSAIFKEIAIL